MPREIDCPDCEGKYRKVRKVTDLDTDILYGNKVVEYCKSCRNGKITVYTQAELNKAVRQERGYLEKLLIYVNPITAPHRHGNKIAKRDLDKLSNLQVEIERAIAEAIRKRGDDND